MPKPFFITTAIDYTNASPHIGHAYEKVLADVIARYRRLEGDEVFFLTGVDQHGQKVQQSAEKQGVPPQEFVEGVTARFLALWEKLNVRYDRWAATTGDLHKQCVKSILQRLWDDRDSAGNSRWIYKARQGGWYSVRQEQFVTDKERGPDGEFGPEWGQVEFREEENYYFRLSEHREWLLGLIDQRTDLVNPEFRRGELRNAAEKLSGDLCISRPKSRLAWGIEFPFDPDFVTYVWFDALVNYLSFAPSYDPAQSADLSEFHRWWPALHVIGKDILIPAHGVYWPVMLKALGFSDEQIPPLLVHGWWNSAGAKMSKSTGNIVDPAALIEKYGAEPVRYYLMSDIVTGKDADFSEERLALRYNTDLANSLGNLLNRTLNMVYKYREGRLIFGDRREGLRPKAEACIKAYRAGMSKEGNFAVHQAMAGVIGLAGEANQYIETKAPWKLAKLPEAQGELDAVLYELAEILRIIAILISPVMPVAARGMFAQLNVDEAFGLANARWGGLAEGHVLGEPTPLFPRLELTQ